MEGNLIICHKAPPTWNCGYNTDMQKVRRQLMITRVEETRQKIGANRFTRIALDNKTFQGSPRQ